MLLTLDLLISSNSILYASVSDSSDVEVITVIVSAIPKGASFPTPFFPVAGV